MEHTINALAFELSDDTCCRCETVLRLQGAVQGEDDVNNSRQNSGCSELDCALSMGMGQLMVPNCVHRSLFKWVWPANVVLELLHGCTAASAWLTFYIGSKNPFFFSRQLGSHGEDWSIFAQTTSHRDIVHQHHHQQQLNSIHGASDVAKVVDKTVGADGNEKKSSTRCAFMWRAT